MISMRHPIHRVEGFSLVSSYVLRITFDDQTEQVIDFEPLLAGDLFGPLRDPSIFRQVRIDPVAHTLVWPNGADFDPTILHDWPDRGAAMRELARRWSSTNAS
jgi:hypothetical protein